MFRKSLICVFLSGLILSGCVKKFSDTPIKNRFSNSGFEKQTRESDGRSSYQDYRDTKGLSEYKIFNKFYFDTDLAVIRADAGLSLMRFVDWLKSNQAIKFSSIRVEGHADERGTREYNMALGAKRANAVKNFIRTNTKIRRGRIKTISYGKERPAMLESHSKAWKMNRRVVIKFLDSNGQVIDIHQ
jgi:peptidoglycan-associated lipoprotein